MPRLNNDERNQAIGSLNAGMSATVVLRHFGCIRKTVERLRKRFRVADRPRSGRSRMTTAADDRYIVSHILNRRLTAAATGGQYGTDPQTARNRLKQNVQPIRAYHTSIKFSPDFIERQDRIAAVVTCISNVLTWI